MTDCEFPSGSNRQFQSGRGWESASAADRGRSAARRRAGRAPDRGLSTVVNYALMLVVVGILVSGLLVGITGHVDGQRERALRAELSVVGNHLAGDIQTVDRLAGTAGSTGTVELRVDLGERVAGQSYLVDVDAAAGTNRYVLTLATDDPDVSAAVHLRTDHQVETGRYHGGELLVRYDGTALEVADD